MAANCSKVTRTRTGCWGGVRGSPLWGTPESRWRRHPEKSFAGSGRTPEVPRPESRPVWLKIVSKRESCRS